MDTEYKVLGWAAGGGFGIWKLASANAVTSEITTTYYAEAVTYGNVDTTISGSGTLTPVTNKTLSCENPCTIDTLNAAVGGTVSEGDVIAVVTQQITETVMDEETMQMTEETTEEELEITADFDGTITEPPVSEGDSLAAGEEIAILMGNDGFTLDLSADETEIANISIGQTVTMTVDAVNGEYVDSCTEDELSRIRSHKIGFIFQQFHLLPDLTVYENAEMPLLYHKLSSAERRERVTLTLTHLGLQERMHHKPAQFSGGQQQRVAIARVLALQPSIILADEPTGNLDSVSGNEVMQIIQTLWKKGNTIVLITHDQSS